MLPTAFSRGKLVQDIKLSIGIAEIYLVKDLGRRVRRFKDRQAVESEVLAWAAGRNAEQARIKWGYTHAKAMVHFEKVPASG